MKHAEIAGLSPLGKAVEYVPYYTPSLLFPIPRKGNREAIGIDGTPPFFGVDLWNAYELSWLNLKGKPEVAIGELCIRCDSPCLVESKSLKLYFLSFNQTKFSDIVEVQDRVAQDLSQACGSAVDVRLFRVEEKEGEALRELPGECLDMLDIETDIYDVSPSLLECSGPEAEETLYSNLLKANCMVTRQPDWASVYIHYRGPKINRASLLKYLVSFRQHNEFHEPSIERIFMDIWRRCNPKKLSVYGRFTRRGGLDINPFRSNFETEPPTNFRTPRQ